MEFACQDFSCLQIKVSFLIFSAEKKRILTIALPTAGGVILTALLLVLFGYYWKQRAKSQEKTAILTARMTGYDDEVSLHSDHGNFCHLKMHQLEIE